MYDHKGHERGLVCNTTQSKASEARVLISSLSLLIEYKSACNISKNKTQYPSHYCTDLIGCY